MKWTPDAEAAIKKVPFFVRKRVRTRVEKEAAQAGRKVVSLSEVKATQARYLSNMASELKGFQLDSCFGPTGCPNRITESDALLKRLDDLLKEEDLLDFLKQRVENGPMLHHEFRVTMADCPNACSQPQIKDIGIIGACGPKITRKPCTRCEACIDVCKENALSLKDAGETPEIDHQRCLQCGKCMTVCPTGALGEGNRGYRVQLAGKLGRHPQLAREVPGVFSEDEVIDIVKHCLRYYKTNSTHGQRFAELFTDAAFQKTVERFGK